MSNRNQSMPFTIRLAAVVAGMAGLLIIAADCRGALAAQQAYDPPRFSSLEEALTYIGDEPVAIGEVISKTEQEALERTRQQAPQQYPQHLGGYDLQVMQARQGGMTVPVDFSALDLTLGGQLQEQLEPRGLKFVPEVNARYTIVASHDATTTQVTIQGFDGRELGRAAQYGAYRYGYGLPRTVGEAVAEGIAIGATEIVRGIQTRKQDHQIPIRVNAWIVDRSTEETLWATSIYVEADVRKLALRNIAGFYKAVIADEYSAELARKAAEEVLKD